MLALTLILLVACKLKVLLLDQETGALTVMSPLSVVPLPVVVMVTLPLASPLAISVLLTLEPEAEGVQMPPLELPPPVAAVLIVTL